MKCEHADLLIMKYMDGEISVAEAEALNAHLLVCPKCKEAFKVYDSILESIEDMPAVEAPQGFEFFVMEKIEMLPINEKIPVYSKKDKIKIAFAGTFAILLSLGALLINYRDLIMINYMNHPQIGHYVRELKPVSDMVAVQTQNIIVFLGKVQAGVEMILSETAGAISLGIISLCIIQAVLVRRRNR